MIDKHVEPPKSAIELIERVNDVLYDDVMEHFALLQEDDNPCWRRGFVRAAFASIEGLIFTMKLEAVWRHRYLQTPAAHAHKKLNIPKGAKLSDLLDEINKEVLAAVAGAGFHYQELLLLMEFTSDLTENGELVTKRGAKISLKKNIQFAFRSLGKAYGITFNLDKGGQGWQQFLRAIKVRDRLTHPKILEQLTVSDDDADDVNGAATWVLQQRNDLRELILKRLKETGEIKSKS